MTVMMWFVFACTGKVEDTATTDVNTAPSIQHEQSTERLVDGDSLEISATITDEDGIASVAVYYRDAGAAFWESIDLEADGDVWSGTIEQVKTPAVEYYIKAVDFGSPEAYAFFPPTGPDSPSYVEVAPRSLSLPFAESFELTEDQFLLSDLNWWTPSDGRNTFAFGITSAKSHTGSYAVQHPRGSEGIEQLSDWLISPPLDFSAETGVMVGWWEYGLNVDLMFEHSLWVSTSSRLPSAGTYVQVTTLEAPESGEWRRYRYVDLSEWAGEPLVYIGWRWQGVYADEWTIDDVLVRSLAPDFSSEISWSPDPISPGEAVDVTVTLFNETTANADSVDVSLTFPEGGVVAAPEPVALSDVSVSADASFAVVIDEQVASNRYLPVVAEVTSGSESWSFEHQLLVGTESFVTLEVETVAPTQFLSTVGYGDPEAPLWSTPLYGGLLEPGTSTLSVEVTDQFDALPPIAGDRWFISVEADIDTTITAAAINYGTVGYVARVPQVIQPDFPSELLIPHPPEFMVTSTSPMSAAPGDSNVPILVSMYNFGTDTQGPVTASIQSLDSTVLVNNGSSLTVDSDIWFEGESNTLSGPSISIDASHITSIPAQLLVVATDGVDVWEIPVEVPVPWPRLGVVSIDISDESGNDDGILDADETAQLEITIANTGDAGASGVVSAHLSLETTSTAMATVVNDNPSFGFVNAGDIEDEDDFSVTVTAGSAGDSLDFRLDMTDNFYTYTDTFQLVLGEAPWIRLSPLEDDIGDSLSSSSPDLLSAEYRVLNGIVYLRIESASVIDPATAFFEAWGDSGGAAYAYYRWVLQSGVATMQGYNNGVGFQQIGTLTAAFPDDHHVILSWDSADMDLAINNISLGIASGWCGPPEYYCDHYPNYWGYPYVSFSSSNWFTINW